MAAPVPPAPASDPPSYRLAWPKAWRVPCVLSVPHSGQAIPDDARGGMNPDADLGALEDPHLDHLVRDLHGLGLPVLTCRWGRAYCDVNRAAGEWDPGMFREPLPSQLASDSSRVRAGLGTFPRFLPPRQPVNLKRLTLRQGTTRWLTGHRPYHRALNQLLAAARQRFGYAVLLDLHSMPQLPGERLPDLVLGDGFGRSCASTLPQAASRAAQDQGLSVARNYPYAGGFITQHYGRPAGGLHALQLEFARPLYMDERSRRLLPEAAVVTETVRAILAEIGAVPPELLRPLPAAMAGED
ncbi:MAG: N-formylglutamate amidohydrolase [Alphaproteobacteria bacterium]|nr:N-formylglutamate amidohydrolase [Alphaproteobacteria bacterium]MCB9929742.1 N-formylglutamate amidohydrolase [Alphaproteobacteria bacterium]